MHSRQTVSYQYNNNLLLTPCLRDHLPTMSVVHGAKFAIAFCGPVFFFFFLISRFKSRNRRNKQLKLASCFDGRHKTARQSANHCVSHPSYEDADSSLFNTDSRDETVKIVCRLASRRRCRGASSRFLMTRLSHAYHMILAGIYDDDYYYCNNVSYG